MEAAFFDLDKTVIATSSMGAFARSFYQEGLISRRSLVKGACTQLIYVRCGASAKRLARIRRSVLALTAGWEQARVTKVVTEALAAVIDPIVYAEALELIEQHRQAGRRVYIVSAAPTEIVEPLARHLGVHGAIASQAAVDPEGRYTGHMDRYAYGPMKAALIRQIAEEHAIDLERSYAYTDSATDLPMLEAVGHPVAVNPDRPLRRIAQVRGWETRIFAEMRVRDTATADESRSARALWPVPFAAAVAATGGITAVVWRRRGRAKRDPSSAARQLARSFLAANSDRPSRARRKTIFFMAS